MNKVILIGRLARDPEIRYTQSGKAVASFSLAVSRRVRNPQDGQQTADFIPIVAWEKLDEAAKTIEEASAPCFVSCDINTEREGEE